MTPLEARLLRLVPRRLVDALERDPREHWRGVALFADISGFSKLADRLFQQRGAHGVEELARVLDANIRPLVDAVERHGGEVVGFPGDAVLACWPDDDIARASERAARCALEARAGLDAVAPVGGVKLKVRQALSAGDLRMVAVGERPRFVVVGGKPMRVLEPLINRVPPGKIILDASIELQAQTLPEKQGARILESMPGAGPDAESFGEPADIEASRPFIDPLLRRRFEAADDDWIAQMRTMGVVFVHVHGGSTLPLADLDFTVRTVQAALARRLGRVVEVVDDDKGLVIVAAFGLPGAHVFRPQAPALVGLELRRQVAERGIEVGVGVATGRVYSGVVGGTIRRGLGLRGNAMNRAARLMMLGAGVRVDEATARESGEAVEFDEGRRERLKGFAEPVLVHEVLAARQTWQAPQIVGRVELRARLEAAGRQPGLCCLLGEPRVGKSAIAAWLAERVRRSGGEPRRAPASPERSDRAGACLAGLLDPESALVRAGERAPLLADALERDIEDTAATAQLQGFVRATALADLLTELLSDEPALLVVEDAQWLDEVSVAALESLSATRPLLLTARPEGGRLPGALQRLEHLARIESLGPLATDEVGALAAASLGLEELPEGLLPWLVEHSGGRPGFVLELLRVLQHARLLEVAEGAVRLFDRTGLGTFEAPTSVEAALAGRVDALGRDAAKALRVAAALGMDVDDDGWRAGCDAIAIDLDAQRATLLDTGVLEDVDGGVRFADPLLQQVAHGQLIREQRETIHGALAQWLEVRVAAARDAHAAQLAWHWENAGEGERALECLDVAFEHARREGLPRRAAAHALAALRVLAEEAHSVIGINVPSARWHYREAVACRGFGDSDTADEHLLLAAEALELKLPSDSGAVRRSLLGQLAKQALGSVVKPKTHESEETWLRGGVLSLLAVVLLLRAQSPEALLAMSLRAVGEAQRSAKPVPSAIAYSIVGVALAPQPKIAQRYLDAGDAQAERLGEPLEFMDAAIGRLMFGIARGQLDRVREVEARVLPLIRASRTEAVGAVLLGLLGVADLFEARLDACAARASEMIEVSDRTGYLQARGWARNIQTSVALWRGQYAEAIEYAREARALLDRRDDPDRLAARALEAAAHLHAGDLDAALRMVEELEPLVEAQPSLGVTALASCAQPVHVWLAAHERGDAGALERARAAWARMKKHGKPWLAWQPRLQLLEGCLQRARGKSGETALSRAVELAREFGMTSEEVLALEALDPEGVSAAQLREANGLVGFRA